MKCIERMWKKNTERLQSWTIECWTIESAFTTVFGDVGQDLETETGDN